MIRFILAIILATSMCEFTPAQDMKSKPQYERLLKGDDEKTAAELEKKLISTFELGNESEAVKMAEKLIAFRAKVQGQDHWQVTETRVLLAKLVSLSKLSDKQRQDYVQASQWDAVAAELHMKGKYKEAEVLFQKSLALTKKILGEEHEDTATRYDNLAVILNAQGEYAESESLYKKTLTIYKKTHGEGHPKTASGYRHIAVNLVAQRKHVEAESFYQKSLACYRKVHGEEHPETALSYYNLADHLRALRKYAEAEPFYQKSLAIRKKVLGEEHLDTALTYTSAAFNLNARGQYAEAEPLYQKALTIFRKVHGEQHRDTAFSYSNLAANFNARGKYTEAESLFQKTMAIIEKVQGLEHPDTALTYNNLAQNLDSQAKYVEAELLLQKALKINKKVYSEEHPSTALSYSNLAVNLNAQGKYTEAEPLLQKALAIYRKVLGENYTETALGYNNLAGNLRALGKHAEAESLYQKALAIEKKVHGEEHPSTAGVYDNLAANLDSQAKYAEAEPLHRKALTIYQKVFGDEHSDTALCYNNLGGNLGAQHKYAEAEPFLQKALTIYTKVLGEEHPSIALIYINLARSRYAGGDYIGAEPYWRKAVFAYEASRLTGAKGIDRASMRIEQGNPRLPLALVDQQKNPRSAWSHVELTLARGLLDQQTQGQSRLTAEENTSIAKAKEQLATLQPQIMQLVIKSKRTDEDTKQLEKLQSERQAISKVFAEIAVAENNRLVAKPEEIQSAIAADAALVVWIDVGKQQQHYACIVRRQGEPVWVKLPGSGLNDVWTMQEERPTHDLRTELGKDRPDFTKINDLIAKVKTQRFTPLVKHLDGIRTLYVVPVGDMAGIPVEALTDKFTISYVPSGTFLARRGKPSDKSASLLAIGNPIFDHPHKPKEWKELPGTQVELGQLQRLFGDRATIHTKTDASEQTLETIRKAGKLKDYRYLHFATHGEGNNVHAFESKLILAQDKLPKELMPKSGEPFFDGSVSAREVLDYWKLDADLVTLSACETALGKNAGGDGLLGFAQAFLNAGSRSVCLSLWKVSDSATTLLMDRFYANLLGKREGLTKPLSKIEALHEAKQWLRNLTEKDVETWTERLPSNELKKQFREAHRSRAKGVTINPIEEPKTGPSDKPYSHPKYWAAFILVGSPD